MNLCLIPPKQCLDLAKNRPMHFLLHDRILVDEQYAEFYRNEKGFKIMDNGAFELGKSADIDSVLKAAHLAKVQEIVAFDQPLEPEITLVKIKDFFESLSNFEKNTHSFMVVPHGRNFVEWKLNFDAICNVELPLDITIGFSIIDLWKHNKLRPYAVGYALSKIIMTDCHLLGLDDPRELWCYSTSFRENIIRSVDTSLPFSVAASDLRLDAFKEAPAHERADYHKKFNQSQIELAKKNIQVLDSIC